MSDNIVERRLRARHPEKADMLIQNFNQYLDDIIDEKGLEPEVFAILKELYVETNGDETKVAEMEENNVD